MEVESMPGKTITTLMKKLYEVKQQRLALGVEEKAILDQLKPMVDPMFDKDNKPLSGDGVILTRSAGKSSTVSADLLLDRGVSPEVIMSATKVTTFFRYLVKAEKAEDGKKS